LQRDLKGKVHTSWEMNADRSSPEKRSGDKMSNMDGGIPCTEKIPLQNPDSNDADPIEVGFTPMPPI
jgi:hypothetical protein